MRAWGRRASVVIAVAALAACTADGEDAAPPDEGVVEIGLLAPLSGPNAAAGRDAQQGAALAVEMINEEQDAIPLPLAGQRGLPGLGGRQVALVAADTGSDPGRGSTETVRLVAQERVAGIVGAYDVEVTAAASLAAERLTTPFVTGATSAEHLTERGLNWFFRVGPTDRMLGEALFSVLVPQEAAGASTRRIAILHPSDQEGAGIAAVTRRLAAEGGYDVAATVGFAPGAEDLAEAVGEVRDAEPDVVFLVATASADARRLVGAFERLEYAPDGLMALGRGFAGPAFPGDAGVAAEGLFRSVSWSPELGARSASAAAVMSRYQQTYNAAMSETAAGAFMAVLTLSQGIDVSGTPAAERVRTSLSVLNEPGRVTIMPWNGVAFDATHQNAAAAATVEQLLDGQPRVVFPQELAAANAAWPLTDARA